MICSTCGSMLATGAILCGECGTAVVPLPAGSAAARLASGETTVLDPTRRAWLPGLAPGRHRSRGAGPEVRADTATGLVRLSFDTGHHAVVTGSGLIGRRPVPDDGESFRHVLAIPDAPRVVSKTHLEFGFDRDGLWVRDRWSANGSVLVPPARAPLPLEAGRRYRAMIGSRVRLAVVEMAVQRVDGSALSTSRVAEAHLD